jgi:hypothetical protein
MDTPMAAHSHRLRTPMAARFRGAFGSAAGVQASRDIASWDERLHQAALKVGDGSGGWFSPREALRGWGLLAVLGVSIYLEWKLVTWLIAQF